MKKLQSNFTTLEQSKKLLEIGVPVGTADCIRFCDEEDVRQVPKGLTFPEWQKKYTTKWEHYTPAWSVGRLMNLYDMCNTYHFGAHWTEYTYGYPYISYLIRKFEGAAMDDMLDFSILKD